MESTKEIDIIKLAKNVLKFWKSLVFFSLSFAVLGVVIALAKPKFYQANVMLAPEVSGSASSMGKGISDIASSFGFDIGGQNMIDAIYPDIYPDIFNSTKFVKSLFSVPVRLKDNDSLRTYLSHLLKDQKMPFWDKPTIWIMSKLKKKPSNLHSKFSKHDPYMLSKEDYALCDAIRGNIVCNVDKKTSVITISVTDQDPMVATIMADTLQKRLQKYITNYRTKKARQDVAYYQGLLLRAKSTYERSRRRYGSFADANQDAVLQSIQSLTEDMENDMQLKYNAYTTLFNQYQFALAKLQEKTPAFTVLQEPVMPYKPSSTPRILIVFGFLLLGFFCDIVWVFFRK